MDFIQKLHQRASTANALETEIKFHTFEQIGQIDRLLLIIVYFSFSTSFSLKIAISFSLFCQVHFC